jgi:flagellar basal-body rod protein FlgF
VGNSYYAAEPAAAIAPEPGTAVRQGMLESSNVNAIAGSISLISVQRQAEMLQRALNTFYSEFDRISATDLPRV